MNREQFTKAKGVISQDATISGAFFDGDGGACAVGGLYMSLHPELEDYELLAISSTIVEQEVGLAFGLTQKEITALENVNDSWDSSEDGETEPEPDEYMIYDMIDGANGSTHEIYTFDREAFEDAVYDYENREIYPNQEVIDNRRLDLIGHLNKVCQEYDEGLRAADWYGP